MTLDCGLVVWRRVLERGTKDRVVVLMQRAVGEGPHDFEPKD